MTNKKTLTEKQIRFIELLPKKAMNVTACCKDVGISRETYYAWLRSDKSDAFEQKVNEAKESMYDFVESKIYEQMNEGNTTMLIFFAKTKMKHRGYVESVERIEAKNEPMIINFNVKPAKGELTITKGKD